MQIDPKRSDNQEDQHQCLKDSKGYPPSPKKNHRSAQQPDYQCHVRNPLRERLRVPEKRELYFKTHDPNKYEAEQ